MTGKFSDLTKLPKEPAMKLLSLNNMKLDTKVSSPPSAPVWDVLTELEEQDAGIDMLKLLAAALPTRERVWWSCLAARDIVGPGAENETRCLRAAEAWVYRPTQENREEATISMEHVDPNDPTANCAMGVMYCDDTLGPGEMSQYPAPKGAGAIAAFAMNIQALAFHKDRWDDQLKMMIDRAIDIAKGGSGKEAKG